MHAEATAMQGALSTDPPMGLVAQDYRRCSGVRSRTFHLMLNVALVDVFSRKVLQVLILGKLGDFEDLLVVPATVSAVANGYGL